MMPQEVSRRGVSPTTLLRYRGKLCNKRGNLRRVIAPQNPLQLVNQIVGTLKLAE